MSSTTLRAITHRLTTTPVEQLPPIASFLATSLSDCAGLLSTPQTQKSGKSDSDNAVQIHKLKTRLASLLQDRSVEGRWTAVILVKATVEAGQWEILRGYEPIVRSLISILAKPDPISTRKMCIITLTRIFHLTYQYPTLVREITTPQLPGFITAALNLVSTITKTPSGSIRKPKPNTPFMEIVLHALLELIPRHITLFRPFGAQLRTLLVEVIGSSSPAYFPEHVIDAAEQLLVSLHKCAPKDQAGSGWKDDCKSTILSIHRTTDHVFRAVVEQWESVDATLVHTRPNYSQEMGDGGPDGLGLPGWSGLHSGVDRLIALLQILSDFISMPSAAAVALPIGSILDLTSRLTAVTVPPNGAASSQSGIQFNQEISRDEREALWMELPRIHIACMSLLSNVVGILATSATSVTQTILEQAVWTFKGEKFNRDLRSAVYALLHSLVPVNGPAMTKQSVVSLTNVLRSCCNDILPPTEDSTSTGNSGPDSKAKSKGGQGTANADAFLNPDLQKSRQTQADSPSLDVQQNASALLQAVFVSIPAELVPPSIRAEMDRSIILTSDKDAMLASVLNPVPAVKGRGAGSSIIPFLTRPYADQMEVEALVRPRMPVLMTAPELDACVDEDEEEAEDEDMADDGYNAAPKTTEFLKQPVSAPLQVPKSEDSKTATPMPSFHKRTFTEETTAEEPTPQKQEVQIKKARFDEIIASTSSQQPFSQPAPAITNAEAPKVSTQVSTASMTLTPQAPEEADDSDDELPTLNIDSDTDEEDDDVTMEG
ncbi:Armadillo-like helical [Penicillium cf. griseofulvum]|uniref:Pre-rRNA-processing protein RIX1 n=1 Tax=Penicillium cf. griseofulvum TaxID=2972120 RepID=A0A9W9JM18_9EURO|nr:Armadillo-like helical [Penicillium cf. griseofulvum]KAJ5442770.1 Armadillo-like helical [Penicillium cf. griseofulvum]KAJ5451424.1 Armadillo-like helical [Penicillium cf. griseofulvum]